MMDVLGVTEHGSSIYGSWLTEKGKALIKALVKLGYMQNPNLSPTRNNKMDNKSFSRFSWYKPEKMGKFNLPPFHRKEDEWIKDTFDHAVVELLLAATGLAPTELGTILFIDFPKVDDILEESKTKVVYTVNSSYSTLTYSKIDFVVVKVTVSRTDESTTITTKVENYKESKQMSYTFFYARESESYREDLERIKRKLIDEKLSDYFEPHIDNAMLTAWLVSTPVKDIVVLNNQIHAAKFRKNLVLLFDGEQKSSSEDEIDYSCTYLSLFHIRQRVKISLYLDVNDFYTAYISFDNCRSIRLCLSQDLVVFIKGVIPKNADSPMDLGNAIRATATRDQEIQDYFNTILTQDTTVIMDVVGGYHVVDTKNNLNFRLDMLPIRRYPLAEAFGVYAGGTCLGQYRDTSKLLDKLSYRRTDHAKTVEQIQSDMVMGCNTNTPDEDGKPCFIDYKQMGSVNLGPCEC